MIGQNMRIQVIRPEMWIIMWIQGMGPENVDTGDGAENVDNLMFTNYGKYVYNRDTK